MPSSYQFILKPDAWPRYPFLPLVNRADYRKTATLRVNMNDNKRYQIAEDTNIWNPNSVYKWRDTTPEEVVHLGWEVD